MKTTIFKYFALLSGVLTAGNVSAQYGIYEVLQQVEQNNQQLAAQRKLTDAMTLEARMQNNLDDPEVEYIHQWGSPSEVGKTGELTVTQSFDFPTVYGQRNKLRKLLEKQYGYEYAAYRQSVLLEAQMLCIDIISLRQKNVYLLRAADNAERIARTLEARLEAGDAGILEENKAKFEYITAMNDLKLNEIDLMTAESALANLNGGIPVTLLEENLDVFGEVLPPMEQMLAIYEAESPEMLAVLTEKDAAVQEIRVTKGMSLPKLTAGYKHEYALGEKFNGVVVGMSIPLFSNKSNVKRARAQAAVAEAGLERTKTSIRTTLSELYAKAGLLRESGYQYEGILERAGTVDHLNTALEAGHISIVEYFSDLQPIYDSYLTMIDVLRDYKMICARINMINL